MQKYIVRLETSNSYGGWDTIRVTHEVAKDIDNLRKKLAPQFMNTYMGPWTEAHVHREDSKGQQGAFIGRMYRYNHVVMWVPEPSDPYSPSYNVVSPQTGRITPYVEKEKHWYDSFSNKKGRR